MCRVDKGVHGAGLKVMSDDKDLKHPRHARHMRHAVNTKAVADQLVCIIIISEKIIPEEWQSFLYVALRPDTSHTCVADRA